MWDFMHQQVTDEVFQRVLYLHNWHSAEIILISAIVSEMATSLPPDVPTLAMCGNRAVWLNFIHFWIMNEF